VKKGKQPSAIPDSAPEPPRILALQNVSLLREETTILRKVSWEVQAGEHWVILGANGSGKTSLLKILTAYETATEGEVFLLGERFGAADWRALRERVGLVSSAIRQRIPDNEAALETVVSGRRAMLAFWGKIAADERADAEKLLRQVRCQHLAEREWRVLSQGERQRVLIARALMADPAVLILDEPCAGLDTVAREQFLHFLQQLGEQPGGPSLVLVTHHVEEIVPAMSHALLLKAGKVVAAGPKQKVLTTDLMKATFGADVRLLSRGGRYRLVVHPRARGLL
jgi:iron complex transport system ATP-binding protein